MEQSKAFLPIGTHLQFGKYRIIRYLSSGGFGNTYIVENVQFEEKFVVKEFFMKGLNERNEDNISISVSNAANIKTFKYQKDKFKKEARRLSKLNNKHLVRVHDLFEENGTAYYVMDYIEGLSLSAIIKQRGYAFSESEVFKIVDQVLIALEEIHKYKIWHLDIKPGNILMDNNNNIVLIDFGASKQMEQDPSSDHIYTTTSISYTPGYAPPEQVDQNIDRLGPYTDYYSLGATIYFLLTNHKPPTISEIQEEGIKILSDIVSTKMNNLIKWLMTPQRNKRPQTVNEIRKYLEQNSEEPDNRDTCEDDTILNPGQETVKNDDEDSIIGHSTFFSSKILYVIVLVIAIISIVIIFFINNDNSDINKDTEIPTINATDSSKEDSPDDGTWSDEFFNDGYMWKKGS